LTFRIRITDRGRLTSTTSDGAASRFERSVQEATRYRPRMPGGRGWAGRKVVITGGASGIGLALGEQLVERGAHVVLADIDGEAVEQRAAELGASGTVVGRQVDVRDEASVRVLVEEAAATGPLDLLVNNAGVALGGPTHELTAAHWDHVIDVNLRGVVNGILAAYPRMVEQGSGHILSTASGAGLLAPPFVTAYAATKHAVVGLSLGLRPEAALHGVGVSVLCPGAVDTPILDRGPAPDLPSTASRPVTPRDYLAAIHQRPVSAEAIAARAIRGIERNRGVIVAPATAAMPWYLHRISPRLAQRVTVVLARRVERRLIRPA
jgi:NAD(P)-dependent dehydrogenase (short-subunit alcohol dehydrogenase family)